MVWAGQLVSEYWTASNFWQYPHSVSSLFFSILFYLRKCGRKPMGLNKSLRNTDQGIRYAFAQHLVPWCFMNLISKCFKHKLADPGALPGSYVQRCPGHINLFRNTRRHVHSSAHLNTTLISASVNEEWWSSKHRHIMPIWVQNGEGK